MKKIKLLSVFLILLSFFLQSCDKNKSESNSGWDVVVSGKVGFPGEGDITLKRWADTTDNSQILKFDKSNYTFQGTVHLTEPGYYRLTFFDNQVVDLILYKSNLEVNADGKANSFFEVLGSPDIEMLQSIQDIKANFNNSPELAQLSEEFNAAVKQRDEKLIEELRAKYQQLLNKPIVELLLANTPSVGVIDFLSKNELDPDKYFSVYEKVAASLTGEWLNYQLGKDFIAMFERMKVVAIGQEAPEIALPNPNGEIVALSSLRGKYVLVDFWAKWCGPCRQENPNVLRVYNKFKDKGFEVFGVSLDRNKKDWVQAIEEDGLKWTQVSDLKYFNSEAARLYNIGAIPFSILLDPKGIIIDKNLRDRALEARLEEIFASM